MPTYDESISLTGAAVAVWDGVRGARYLWFSGAETGMLQEFPVQVGLPEIAESPVRTGQYSLKCAVGSAAGAEINNPSTTGFFRGSLYILSAVAEPTLVWETQIEGGVPQFRLFLNEDGTLSVAFADDTMLATGTDRVRYGQWNQIEWKCVEDASVGGMEVYLNNVQTLSSFVHDTVDRPTGSNSMAQWVCGPTVGSGPTMYFDDLAAARGSYIGSGAVYALRPDPLADPTYANYLVQGATSAARAWADDNTASFTLSLSLLQRQTARVEDPEFDSQSLIKKARVLFIGGVSAVGFSPWQHALTYRIGGNNVDTDVEIEENYTGAIVDITEELLQTPLFDVTFAQLATFELGARSDVDPDNGTLLLSEAWLMLDVRTPSTIDPGGLSARNRIRFTATVTAAPTGDVVEPFLVIIPEVIV